MYMYNTVHPPALIELEINWGVKLIAKNSSGVVNANHSSQNRMRFWFGGNVCGGFLHHVTYDTDSLVMRCVYVHYIPQTGPSSKEYCLL